MAASRIRRFFGADNGRPVKHGLVAALVTALVLGTAGGSYAYWTTSASVSSTPRAATLVVTASAVSLNATYGNDLLVSTSTVTVTNTTNTASTTVPALSIALTSAGGDAALASATAVKAWPVASAGACSAATAVPASGVSAGTWGGGVTVAGLTLAKSTTLTICVRSTIANRNAVASAGGSLSFTPAATATLSVANFAGSTSAMGTQSTQYIYSPTTIERQNWWFIKPLGQGNCLDVSGGGNASGTNFINFGCKDPNDQSAYIWNQQWTFLPSANNFVEIKPRNAPLLRVDNNDSASTTAPLTLTTAGALGTDDSKQWLVQLVQAEPKLYQFVNKVNGLCMNAGAGAGDVTQAVCNGSPTQKFALESPRPIVLDNITCAISGTGVNRVLTYTFYSNDNGAYALQTAPNNTTDWTTRTTTGVRATSVSMVIGGFASTNAGVTYKTQILDVYNVQVDAGTFIADSNSAWSCT